MGPCHRNPYTCLIISSWCWAHGGCAVDPSSLLFGPPPSAAVPARLRLLVVPCLNARRRHVRDPPYFFNSLLAPLYRAEDPTQRGEEERQLADRLNRRRKRILRGVPEQPCNRRVGFRLGVQCLSEPVAF